MRAGNGIFLSVSIIFLSLFIVNAAVAGPGGAQRKGDETMVKDIHWLGHDTFRIEGEKLIYTDPFKIRKKDSADIILITHEHYDHCSPDDVKKLQGPNTVIVAPSDCGSKFQGNVRVVRPGDKIDIAGIQVD